jgi:DnaJ-class molecular chaperone
MAKNYYLILGITADANREDIKAAFRRRAFELHPDRSGLGSGPFQDVQEAYSVLGDPERRRRYDQEHYGAGLREGRARPSAEPLPRERPRGEPLRPVEPARGFREAFLTESFATYRPSFDELFDRFWSNFEGLSRPKSEQLESLTVDVLLSPAEAAQRGRVRIWMPARARCPACRGRGDVGFYECWRCEGHGAVSTEYPVDVEYPPDVPDAYAVRVSLASFGIENFYLVVLFRVG